MKKRYHSVTIKIKNVEKIRVRTLDEGKSSLNPLAQGRNLEIRNILLQV
ncbi:hypothetical protein [Thermus sp.]|nr:hypothetical protein [Thermus sp.]MCX7850916.1 hypothetical protein [Thermus sp.]